MNIILLGAPGSGKGTQSEKIAEHFKLAHISGGQQLRKEVESGTRRGELIGHIMEKGDLVPFDEISSVIEPELIAHKDGFVLDGSPRDLVQAEYLDKFLTQNNIVIDKVIYLSVPEEKLITRLLKRAELENREDDTLESITERFRIFHEITEPVLNYYRHKSNLLEIDGDRSVEDIAADLRNIIGEQ